jgi:CBS domain-containing protein
MGTMAAQAAEAHDGGHRIREDAEMIVADLSSATSPRLAAIATTATVKTAASALSTLDLGMLVVCNEGGPVVGVVSKSDLVRHMARDGAALAGIAAVMTRDVVTCSMRDDLQVAWTRMVDRGVQNLPVLNDEARPVGVLDIRDALRALLEQEGQEERQLINYVAGIGYR